MSRRPTRRPAQPEPAAILAAELALGVLDAEARTAAEERAASDPAFAAEAAEWSARLHPLAEGVPSVAPDGSVWARIEEALPARRPAPTAKSADEGEPVHKALLRRWRLLAVGMAVAAAACFAALAVTVGRQASDTPLLPPPLLSARLTPPAETPVLMASEALYTATVDRAHRSVVVTPVNPGPTDPRVRELWVIPEGGKPVSLGLLDASRAVPLSLGAAQVKLVNGGGKLAVTLEPKGGAPGGVPTGPIIAAGVLARI